MEHLRLGDILISTGAITQEQLQHALEVQKSSHERLGAILIDEGLIDEQRLIETLEVQLGIDSIDLNKIHIPIELTRLVPCDIARRYSVVPVKLNKNELTLAMSDPLNFVAIEEVRTATRKRIVPMISTPSAVSKAISTLYGKDDTKEAANEARCDSTKHEKKEEVADDTQAEPAVRFVKSILERASLERASIVHIEPRSDEMVVRMRIDGKLRTVLTVPHELRKAVISRLKIMGGMDIEESRVPQEGRANMFIGHDIDLRISALPTLYGEKTVVRLYDKSKQLLDAQSIGLMGKNLDKYNKLLKNVRGMVLIVGPNESGKSSTMYTMIRSINTDEVNLVTLENPIEYEIEGVNQVQIDEKVGMTFASGLKAILRQDPDIIAIGEIRDVETAEIAIRAALMGHLVLATVNTNDAITAIDRLISFGVKPDLLAEALNGVISQRLVRKICPNCKEEYIPGEEEPVKLGFDRHHKFYHGKGCPQCYHTGYLGRTGVFDILIPDVRFKKAVSEGNHKAELIKCVNNGTCSSLKDACRELVLEGITSVEEAVSAIGATAD